MLFNIKEDFLRTSLIANSKNIFRSFRGDNLKCEEWILREPQLKICKKCSCEENECGQAGAELGQAQLKLELELCW